MKKCNTILIGLITFFLSQQLVNAQQEVNYSLYRYHLNLINPAVTGTQGATYLNMSLRSQWVGIKDAPETQAISMGTPNTKNNLGTGFSIINDKTFVENRTQLFFDFSYKVKLAEKRDLYLGLKAGGTSIQVDAQKLSTFETTSFDPFLVNNSSFVPNIGVGFYYRTPKYYLSVSVPRVLNTERFSNDNGQVTRATDRPHIFASTGISLKLNENWKLYPSILSSYVSGAPIDLIGNLSFTFKEKFDLGVQITNTGQVGATSYIHSSPKTKFGYSYSFISQDQVNSFSNGIHELIFKIKLGKDKDEFEREASFTQEKKIDKEVKEEKIGTTNKSKILRDNN